MLLWIVLLLPYNFLIPKKILEKYFKEPYFRKAEVVMFSGFPLAYIRSCMFMRLFANPSSGRVRKLDHVYKEVPEWLIYISKTMLIILYSLIAVFLLLFVIFGVVIWLDG